MVVRDTDDDSEGLDVALVANMSRVDLDPVEEARGMRRLVDAGLTRKGVAEKLSLPPARVRERLQLLELPEELLPQIADGSVPLSVAKPLAELAKIHPELLDCRRRDPEHDRDDQRPSGSRCRWVQALA